MRVSSKVLATLAVLGLVACTDPESTAPTLAPTAIAGNTSVTYPASPPWARIVEGEVGPGALYAIYIPEAWNGDAIYYSHGIRDVDSPVDLRDQNDFFVIRDMLGAQGYAIAYSSWSENGLALKDGSQRVHQMRGILASELKGKPKRSFLLGHSLGSAAALELAESYPTQYDGALLTCGTVGGTLLETQYAGHVRALFDAFYPGALPGDVMQIPPGTPVVTLPDVIAAVSSNPMPLFVIGSLEQTPLPYVPVGSVMDPASPAFQTLVGSLYAALQFQMRFANNMFDLSHGHPTFDNNSTVYALSATPLLPGLQPAVDLANATVKRYAMDPAGTNFITKYFTPSGDLRIPVLTLHNTWDPGVPAFHEAALLAKVQAKGATPFLLQRFYPAYGHCAIPAAVQVQNFLDMVNWVTTGTKPAS